MAALRGLLPKPMHQVAEEEDSDDELENMYLNQTGQSNKSAPRVPPYGKRKGWTPKTQADFGNGGAYPEIHVLQYPSGLGQAKTGGKDIVPLKVDAEGKVRYDAILRQGAKDGKTVYSTYRDLVPVAITAEDDPQRALPSEDEVAAATEKTRETLEKLVGGKLIATKATHVEKADTKAQFIRYTPSLPGQAQAPSDQRVIRMVEKQKDPLEPPKFATNKKIPKGPGSPPAPVMHSPTRKATAKEQNDWKIPPCVSSYKNHKGFTIPLDKRMVADGRGLQDVQVNEKFAKFAQALYTAERKSREAIQLRNQLQKKAAQKEREQQEEEYRSMAQRAREERAGITSIKADDQAREREEIRDERRRERERQHRLDKASHDTRTRVLADKDRDISERIALGLPATNNAAGQHDARLYNQSMGLGSGFGDDDAYNVYDRPMRSERTTSIYRPTRGKDEFGDDDYERIKSTDRFRADKGFSGTEGASRESGPVQFEKEEDFGLNDFLKEAKNASKSRTNEESDSKRSRK